MKTIDEVLKCLKSDCRGCERENYASCEVNSYTIELLEELAQAKKWISCKEEMPQKHTFVLACFDDGFITGVEFADDWELWAESGEVTHWMLLPAPPKIEKEGKDEKNV